MGAVDRARRGEEEDAVTRNEARAFAEAWAAAWNESAVERVLAHFDDDVHSCRRT